MTYDEKLVGTHAQRPREIPARGWWQVVRRGWRDSKDDNMPLMAAGVAFWLFLSLFPSVIALITVYGLVTDPQEAARQVEQVASALPESARATLTDQVESVTGAQSGTLTFSLVASLLAALWTASTGTMNLIKATNIAYDEDEQRGFLKLRAIALVTTLVVIVFVAVSIALVVVAPVVLEQVGLGVVATVASQVLRWAALVLLVGLGLALLYRYAPNRDAPMVRWVSVGATVATVIWIAASVGFSYYVSNFGSYNETYGALAGVIVLLLWLYLTSFIVLLGAEINAETEHQTGRDTTKGPERPMGERHAHVADTYPDDTYPDDARAAGQRSGASGG
jgi:membrane protein